jgi:hypothetical protein
MVEDSRNLLELKPASGLPLILVLALLCFSYWGSPPELQAGPETGSSQAAVPQATVPSEAQRMKFQSLVDTAWAEGVRISEVVQLNGKFVIKGTAPSVDAVNKVWEEVKRIDPRMARYVADFRIDSSLPQAHGAPPSVNIINVAAAGAAEEKQTAREEPAENTCLTAAPGMQTYVVQPGDTLSSISQHFYGRSGDYPLIFEANKEVLKDENSIQAGQELTIP